MTAFPSYNSRVLYRETEFHHQSTGRVCGRLIGGLNVKPKVEIETQDGDRIMVAPENVEVST